jgi:hypothetical protein
LKRLWETISAVLITALIVKLLFDMIKPYAFWLVVGLLVLVAGGKLYSKNRNW